MTDKPDTPSRTWAPPSPPTTRRNEVEQARRTTPVQSLRSHLRDAGDGDDVTKAMAEVMRKLLRRE
jgi:hypothetical protein